MSSHQLWMHRMYQALTGEADEAREAERITNLVRDALEASSTSQVSVAAVIEATGLTKAEILGVLDDEALVHMLGVATVEYQPSTNTIEVGSKID